MYVYVIKSKIQKKWIKIGSTINLEKRLRSIKNGSAGGDNTCEIILVIETIESYTLEKYLHDFFDKYNRNHYVAISDTNYIEYKEWFDRRICTRLVSLICFLKFNNFYQIKKIIFKNKDLNKRNNSIFISFIDIKERKYLSVSRRRTIFIETIVSKHIKALKNATLKEVKKNYKSLNKFMKNFEDYISINNEINYSLNNIQDGIDNTFYDYQELCKYILVGDIERKYLLLKNSGKFDMIFYFEYIGLYLHKARKEALSKTISSKEKRILNFCVKYRKDILDCYRILVRYTQSPIILTLDIYEFETIYNYQKRMKRIEDTLTNQLSYLPNITALLTDIQYFEDRGFPVFYSESRHRWYTKKSLQIIDDIEL